MKVGTSTIAFAISAILIGAAPLVAQAQATAEVARSPGKVEVSQTIKMTATVVGIDLSIRDVTLIDSQGRFHTVNVGDQARNLDQVKVGDKVAIEYTEAISLQLKKRGTADARAAERAGGDDSLAPRLEARRGRRTQGDGHCYGRGNQRPEANRHSARTSGQRVRPPGRRPGTAQGRGEG